ncbi:MAG: 4-(cytidine 5'-diphospho)-2-C-methyl-D-erythritol kinase, partial [Candidatus Omnitrophica bacterium]|nr:4-(cytidine 5'-diphospho)-2-C-methyl-D-erythritol kinase [Candidatus Omnitrophota bacterium]
VKRLVINSYAKLNLYLEVLNQRKDGYHNITTLFERIGLADKITLSSLPDKIIKISSNSEQIPSNQNNLAYKAARILQKSLNLNKGVEIRIIKKIPVGSGMGGGSSNAASTLLGLNKLWKLNLSRAQLVNFAQKLGSDVPFFIYNCPFALGEARGEKIRPVKSLTKVKFWHLIVVPRIFVSTPKIYQGWDRAHKEQKAPLTSAKSNVKLVILSLRKKDLSGIGQGLFNSLEEITIPLYPDLVRVKEALRHSGLEAILMSGSGPAVFAISGSRKEAESVYARLKNQKFAQLFLTRTK